MSGWVNVDNWNRSSHFRFFRDYEQPFFNVCTEIDVSALHERCTLPDGPSFFLATIYSSIRAANENEPFRLRLRDGRVWRHDVVHPGSTILREDETFAFAYFEYQPDYASFERAGRAVIERVRAGTDALVSDDTRDDVIYYSVLPWIRFTSFAHARRSLSGDSIPRIVFGKHFERDGIRWLPVSVEVHHALVDGLDVARFLERLSALVA